MRVGILGGGQWGQALARLVIAAGHEPYIAYRDKRPPHILPSTDDPPQVSGSCELLLVATSAAFVRQAIQLAQPGPQHRIVVAGRGLDPVSADWLTDAVLQECDAIRVGALAGPAPIDEILNGGLCAGVVASRYDEVCRMTMEALHSPRYRVYASNDLLGVQLAGAMMPILATLVGLTSSLGGAGVGLHAMIISRGVAPWSGAGCRSHNLSRTRGCGRPRRCAGSAGARSFSSRRTACERDANRRPYRHGARCASARSAPSGGVAADARLGRDL